MVGKNPQRTLFRSLALSSAGEILVAPMEQYAVEVWSPNLQLMRRYQRSVSWFPAIPSDKKIDYFARTPMPAQVMSISDGREQTVVLVNIVLARRDWKADPVLAGTTGETISKPAKQMGLYINDYMDTIVEAFDPANGEV